MGEGRGWGELAFREEAEGFELGDLFGVARGLESTDVLWAAVGVAAGDEFFGDDGLA